MLFDVNRPFALFETQIDVSIEHPFELFYDPIEEIKTYELENVLPHLRKLEELSGKGYFLVGYIAYEALTDFLEITTSDKPLIYFYAFAQKQSLSAVDFEKNILPLLNRSDVANGTIESPLLVYDFQINETFESYQKKISKIKHYQRQGDTYQVNFTMKNRFKWQGNAFEFFLELKKYQKVVQAAFFHFDTDICSYSPELFIRKDGDIITAKPMKGTAPRGNDSLEDDLIVRQMRQDAKTISENLMIVDLIRNDLGKIALPGTVSVPKLFEVESYATLHQMTSTIQAKVPTTIKFEELMQALFPCGSITGAPKKSTMKIIHELEAEPRHLYTGALGFILPTGDFVFNVAIRTLILSKNASGPHSGEMGIGSGIIWESDIANEWDECLLKAKFIKMINSPVQLIETFRYDANSSCFLRLNLHLQRLTDSAEGLGFVCFVEKIKTELNSLLDTINKEQTGSKKIRLLLFQNGGFQITNSPLEPVLHSYRVIFCKVPIQKQSLLQRHKTTCRTFYENFLQKAKVLGYDEIIFFNEDSFCAEASRHNVIIKSDGRFKTPPVIDGALPGVFRQSLLADQSFKLHEESFTWKELAEATEVYLCNSVRGMVRAEVFPIWLEGV